MNVAPLALKPERGIKSQGRVILASPSAGDLEEWFIVIGVTEAGEALELAYRAWNFPTSGQRLELRRWLRVFWTPIGRRRAYTIEWKLETGARK